MACQSRVQKPSTLFPVGEGMLSLCLQASVDEMHCHGLCVELHCDDPV